MLKRKKTFKSTSTNAPKRSCVHQLMRNDAQDSELDVGTFITPTLIELPNLNDLEREVFGPGCT
jgi:delta 1-pyrroline-5-carboxylate dehydrogenase